jgi:hypothetical protein
MLAMLDLQPLLCQLALHVTTLSGVGVLKVGQTLAQIVHGGLVVDQM